MEAAHGPRQEGCGSFTVWEGGCWQPRGEHSGCLVHWPRTKARGVRAIVPGTSLRRAGKRNTSQGEALWERSRGEQGCRGLLPGRGICSSVPQLRAVRGSGATRVDLATSPTDITQPHPQVGDPKVPSLHPTGAQGAQRQEDKEPAPRAVKYLLTN